MGAPMAFLNVTATAPSPVSPTASTALAALDAADAEAADEALLLELADVSAEALDELDCDTTLELEAALEAELALEALPDEQPATTRQLPEMSAAATAAQTLFPTEPI